MHLTLCHQSIEQLENLQQTGREHAVCLENSKDSYIGAYYKRKTNKLAKQGCIGVTSIEVHILQLNFATTFRKLDVPQLFNLDSLRCMN